MRETTLENLIDFINKEKNVDLRIKGSAGKKKFYIRCYFLMAHKYFVTKTHREISVEINRDHATSIYHKDKMIDLMSIYKADKNEFEEIEFTFLDKYPELKNIQTVYESNCNYTTLGLSRKIAKQEIRYKELREDWKKSTIQNNTYKRKLLNRDEKIKNLKQKNGFISQLTRSLTAAKRTVKNTKETNDILRASRGYYKNKSESLEYELSRLKGIEVKLVKVG